MPLGRPGSAQAKFLAEVGQEEQKRNIGLLLDEIDNYQRGVRPSGPHAKDLIEFFDAVDGKLTDEQRAAPKIILNLGNVGAALKRGDPAELQRLYEGLRLEIIDHSDQKAAEAVIRLGRDSERVRGGTRTLVPKESPEFMGSARCAGLFERGGHTSRRLPSPPNRPPRERGSSAFILGAPVSAGCLHGMFVRSRPQGHADRRPGQTQDFLRKQVLTSATSAAAYGSASPSAD